MQVWNNYYSDPKYKYTALVMAVLLLAGINGVWAKESATVETTATQLSPAASNERVVYTIEGKKDPRLQATYLATYISTSKSEACSHRNPSTATRKVSIGSKRYPITQESYRIEIPVYLEENENECGYRFSRIELILRRLYDNDLYSSHILLDQTPKVSAIYFGYKTGMGGGGKNPLMPATLFTDKRYFRIARQTRYICRTEYYAWKHSSGFYCFMQIRDGEGEDEFIWPTQYSRVTHLEFGIDEIRSDTLHVDILADDLGSKAYTGKETIQDRFRTLPKPKPSQWQTSKKALKQWFLGLF
jgi:hypothetical protein